MSSTDRARRAARGASTADGTRRMAAADARAARPVGDAFDTALTASLMRRARSCIVMRVSPVENRNASTRRWRLRQRVSEVQQHAANSAPSIR